MEIRERGITMQAAQKRMNNDPSEPQEQNNVLWAPSAEVAAQTRLAFFMNTINKTYDLNMTDYDQLWRWSVQHTDVFWSEFWDYAGIVGEKGERALINENQMPGATFFPDAKINYAENMLRFSRGENASKTAITFWGEDQCKRHLTRGQVYEQVSKLAQYLRSQGVQKGDRVAAFIANTPEAVIGLLACASIGAIWSSASPDFGVQGVLDRFGQVEPKVLLATEGYYYNGKEIDCLPKIKEIASQIPSLEAVILVPYLRLGQSIDAQGIDKAVTWDDALQGQEGGDIPFERSDFNHPLYIMFSSGTTGVPKCIVHGAGGSLIQHMKEHLMQCDSGEDDRVFYFTTCGWMMWNWQVTAMACGAVLCLYDGSPFAPNPNILFDYADKEGFTLFGTSAKYIDALNKHDVKPRETHNLDTVRAITSTGSPLVHESFDYIYRDIKHDVHLASISGGTDIVSCFVLGNPISPVYRGEIQCAGLGMAVAAFDDEGKNLGAGGGKGELVCTKPFPSMPVAFWNDEDGSRYHGAYFERFDNIWAHGDWVEQTENGGWIIYGRSDATLNPGGVRIGTAEIYRQVEQVESVMESIAVGQDTGDGDVRVVLFVTLKDGVSLSEDLQKEIKTKIRNGASPRHVPAIIVAVNDIPRTKSGKITEIAVRDVIHGRAVKNQHALANPESLKEFENRPELAL
jgi:acetoacetyl-CoA synthetase